MRPHTFPLTHERVSGAVCQFAKTCPLTADVKIEYRPFNAPLTEKIQVRVANTEVKIAITEQLLFQNFSLANLSHLTHFQKAERPFWIGSNQAEMMVPKRQRAGKRQLRAGAVQPQAVFDREHDAER